MLKVIVVGLACVAVWLFLPTLLPFLRGCPLVAYGQSISYAFLLACVVGVVGWRK